MKIPLKSNLMKSIRALCSRIITKLSQRMGTVWQLFAEVANSYSIVMTNKLQTFERIYWYIYVNYFSYNFIQMILLKWQTKFFDRIGLSSRRVWKIQKCGQVNKIAQEWWWWYRNTDANKIWPRFVWKLFPNCWTKRESS